MINIRALKTWRGRVDLFITDERGSMLGIAEPIAFKVVENEMAYTPPQITLEMGAAQLLMDELWQCGLRPSEGTGSAGSLAATERHLKESSMANTTATRRRSAWRGLF